MPSQCNPDGTYWTAVLLSVAPFLRLTQSIRRWVDSDRTQTLHLINAGKYASSVLHFFFYIHWRYNGEFMRSADDLLDGGLRFNIAGSSRPQDLALWVTFGCIYSIYTSSWDIILDWSLLRPHAKFPGLRNELCYEAFWPWYYFAMVSAEPRAFMMAIL